MPFVQVPRTGHCFRAPPVPRFIGESNTMWTRLLRIALVALLVPLGPATAADLDWATWMRERRDAMYRDIPAELKLLARQTEAARKAHDDEAWALWAGGYLSMLSTYSDAAAEPLAAEAEAALAREPGLAPQSVGRFSLLIGLARYRFEVVDMDGVTRALDAAQVIAKHLGQSELQVEVDSARASQKAYQSDSVAAEALAQRALNATQDPLLKVELFFGPLTNARLLGIQSAEAAQGLLADFDKQLSAADVQAHPYLVVFLGTIKAVVLNHLRQTVQAQGELSRWLNAAKAQPGFEVPPAVRSIQGGLYRDQQDWAGCIETITPLGSPRFMLLMRVDSLITMLVCQASARSPEVMVTMKALDQLLPALAPFPAMTERALVQQARAYEAVGDWQAAVQKHKAVRQAMVARYAKANEGARKQVETAYQVAAKDKENAELKAREALSEQRRLTLGVALAVAVVVLLLVAELLRRQSAQRRRLAELAADLERVNGDLSTANARLNELNASRTRLVAAACHDLRQPAHALGLLAEIATAKASPQDRPTLESIRRSSSGLSDLLDALFDLSRLESDRYVASIGVVTLGDLFDDLRTQFTVAALSKGLTLRIDPAQGTVRSDAHLLRRILMNLLSNAIKYTVTGGVHIHAQRQGDDWLVSVNDTGPGIAPEQQEAAFSEYVRLDSSRGSDGLGIGLAIVKRSATLLGHRLELASTVGQGSSFTLWLQALDDTAVPVEAAPEAGGAGQIIGLVDDDEQIRQAMCELLRLRGYCAHAAPSLEALQLQLVEAGTPRPHLVLSDFHLGASESLGTLAALVGEGGPWAGVPAVLITGDLSPDVLAQCQSRGITVAYKPLPARKLTQVIEKALEGPHPIAPLGTAGSASAQP